MGKNTLDLELGRMLKLGFKYSFYTFKYLE